MGDLGFFGIGEKDYSETFSVRSCFSNGQMFPPSHRLRRDLPSSDFRLRRGFRRDKTARKQGGGRKKEKWEVRIKKYKNVSIMNNRHDDIASALPADLDALPRLRGFRLRGIEMTRLETFIDAAFAFAISMLVIAAQQIPDNIVALLAAFKNVPTFVCCIAVLGIFWRGHWLWSRRYGLEDSASILISWAMIVTVLILMYPLKAIFGAMWYLISSGHVGQRFSLHTTESQARTILRFTRSA
jgi:Endosomal/lysosomal potassium channel TMEM175